MARDCGTGPKWDGLARHSQAIGWKLENLASNATPSPSAVMPTRKPSDSPQLETVRHIDPIDDHRSKSELTASPVMRRTDKSSLQARAGGFMMMLVGDLGILALSSALISTTSSTSSTSSAPGRLWSLFSPPSRSEPLMAGNAMPLRLPAIQAEETTHSPLELNDSATDPATAPTSRASQSANPSLSLSLSPSPALTPPPFRFPSDGGYRLHVSAEVLRDYEQRLRTSQVNPLEPFLPHSHACANFTTAYPRPGHWKSEWNVGYRLQCDADLLVLIQ